jgi:hypothetical protein
MELKMTLHKLVFKEFHLFTEIGHDKYYITWISSHLKPSILIQGQTVYNEDDEIDGFYFVTKGLSSFILPRMSGMIYAIIDPEKQI